MPVFPQVNGNLIITQLPYTSNLAFETVVQDLDCGMRYTFPRRASGLTGYPTGPLGRYDVNFTRITDDEADELEAFFHQMKGRLGEFVFLDPLGNLLADSEDFQADSWDLSGGVSYGYAAEDPFGNLRASALAGNSSDSYMQSTIGSADGGLSGYVVNCSAWVNARDTDVVLNVGVRSSSSEIRGTKYNLPLERWVRIDHTQVLWDNNEFRFILGGNGGSWGGGGQLFVFGAQAVATKGPGFYAKSPERYGYRPVCRFDTDVFERKHLGPNENAVSLPIKEVNA